MKRTVLSIAFVIAFAAAAFAAPALKYERVGYRHDVTLGTFVSKGVRYGRIVGVEYRVSYRDGGRHVVYGGAFDVRPALKKFPTSAAAKRMVDADFKAKDVVGRASLLPFSVEAVNIEAAR